MISNPFSQSRFIIAGWIFVALLVFSMSVIAQESEQAESMSDDQIVGFSASYFERFRPETALQMVNQVPGFQPDDGSSIRGFGAAAGNILINGRRPTAKQDTISATLARIPAGLVDRIDLIRGQVRGIELQGQSAVVNVILRADVPAAVYWEILARYNFEIQPVTLIPTISLTDRLGAVDYNAGFFFRNYSNGDPGTKEIFNQDGDLIEERIEPQRDTGYETRGNLSASTWIGQTLLGFNTSVIYVEEELRRPSHRYPVPAGPVTDVFIGDDFWTLDTEIGFDAERQFHRNLLGKAIVLYNHSEKDSGRFQRELVNGIETLDRFAETDTKSSESIARLEFFWTAIQNHNIQFNLEGVINVLDSGLVQTEDQGGGPEIVDVPGANKRVKETRGNFFLKDTWDMGSFELDYGIGLERSTISQTGDAEQKRSFTYFKPHTVLTYSPVRERQTRIRIAREVSQLNFNAFVSASDFEDDNIDLGNPNLRPERTWVAEVVQEWRSGTDLTVKLTAFHHWITGVLDRLPLSASFDVPGNIGDGRRWGTIFETTIPLDFLRLENAKFTFRTRWQDSSVSDPVTGDKRVLSDAGSFGTAPSFQNENKWAVDLGFRQDFEQQRVAWGWSFRSRAERPVFRVNEYNVYDDGSEFNAFIETTRWFGLKLRLEGANVTNHIETRDRIVFTGRRDLSPVSYREITEAYNGARAILIISGTF